MTPTPLDLDALERVAKDATQGPWFHNQAGKVHPSTGEPFDWIGDGHSRAYSKIIVMRDSLYGGCPDYAHIATFDPPTVLALLSRLQSAEAALAEAERPSNTVNSASNRKRAVQAESRATLAEQRLAEAVEVMKPFGELGGAFDNIDPLDTSVWASTPDNMRIQIGASPQNGWTITVAQFRAASSFLSRNSTTEASDAI